MWFTQAIPAPGALNNVAAASALRPGMAGFSTTRSTGKGTARGFVWKSDVRATSGWLLARRPLDFMARRESTQGTALILQLQTMVRAASGWLFARPSGDFHRERGVAAGTARQPRGNTVARAASGWLSARAPGVSGDSASGDGYHVPVMAQEVAEWMRAEPGKFIIDGTLGGGGHSRMFLDAGAEVLGIDRDPEALAHARARLAEYGPRFSTWQGNFSQLEDAPALRDGRRADGILLDLGVSSRQLDAAERGFSFMREGPLDMRMGPSSSRTAADIVNDSDEAGLIRILRELGEEPQARRIAAAIVKHRASQPFCTTTGLAKCIEDAVGRRGRIHPATRTFQALRMAVNEELDSLAAAMDAAPRVLKPGGRLLIITFHSLEDRMVKRFLRHRAARFLDEPGWPEPRPNPDCQFELPTRKAILPTATETKANPRARSAKLRVAYLMDTRL
jgi:16S rRNA (cytosine1402-N4)-methyltransferase